MTTLPVTVLVVLDGLGVGFGVGFAVGFGVGFAADFVAVGEVFADDGPLDAVTAALVGDALDGCGELAGTELSGAELVAAEPTGVDESGAVDEALGVVPESATGRGAFAGVVLKLSRTTSPATVANKTETKRRMTHPPLKSGTTLEFE
ncbi:MAG TPA: hypothetical protein VN683_09860 [Acidothermaceae bacterium]|nr:hypothetical protein [Acidothermaceae bacterium]